MIVRPVTIEEKDRFNEAAVHPLQTWEWGEFREANGQEVARLGMFDESGRLQDSLQVTFHAIPVLGGTAGYFPKGPKPNEAMLIALQDLGRKHGALFIKMEPNVHVPADGADENSFAEFNELFTEYDARPAKHLFTPYSFVLDLTESQEELMSRMKSKTRYNVRLAQRKGVRVVEDTSEQGMEEYLRLLRETTNRQGFYAHDEKYFRTMWQTIGDSGMIRILKAEYEDTILAVWVLFFFQGVAYYPYGASSSEYREVMASNLMMWEAILLAKESGCQSFDMWGALGPDAPENHKWRGFHHFKEGYGAPLMLSLPTHDLVLNGPLYSLFTIADALRWQYLRLRARLGI